MDIKTRILNSRLIERMHRNPEYSSALGLKDRTQFCQPPAPADAPPRSSEAPEPPAAPDAPESAQP